MLARRHLRRATDVYLALLGSMSTISCGPADIISPRPSETVAAPATGTSPPSSTPADPGHASAGATVAGDAGASMPASSNPSPEGGPASTNEASAEPPAPGDYVAGTELVTTGDLNLREGPGSTFAVISVMPMGARVVVVRTSGADGWVNIRYGADGYASKTFLALAPPPISTAYDPARGKVLADRAYALWNGKPSRDLCLAGVDDSVETSGIIPVPPGWLPRQPSAVAWGDYAKAHPVELAQRGFRALDVSVNEIPQGSIIVWQPGQCGYHALYGHIEIVIDLASSRACSDYCGNIKKTCGPPVVYVPIQL
jgi:hypothetical protein